MKREIKFVPCPMRDGTESSLEVWFQVIGELGITEFQLESNWYTNTIVDLRLKEMKRDVALQKEDFLLKHVWMNPNPLNVCYFSPVRISEDDSMWMDGDVFHAPNMMPCYYGYRYEKEVDGRWTTEFVYEKLLREGNNGVWKFLEDYYVEVFGELR